MPWMAAAIFGLLTGLGSCAKAETEAPPALPSYSPAEAALFDDTFSVDIFGSAAVEPPTAQDKLRERVVLADSVIPARITTVTRDAMGTIRGYTLTVKPTGPPMAGRAVTEPIQISIGPDSPAFVRVRSAETTLVNQPLVLFLRYYEVDGTEQLHWRAESNTEAVRSAVSQATAVRAGRAGH